MITLQQGDCLELMKGLEDNSIDLIFTDPPYNLSSQVYIKENGKPDLKKAKDFMDKWTGLDGQFLEEFYKECLRVLKHGGHCLLFGIDRQLLV
jgi:site-specific DNA-methyltransferase (adenine-specific)